MRNILALVVILLVCGSVALAQHTNVVNSTGNNNDADVIQAFVGSGTSFDGNETYVDQIGDDNDADVYQNNNGYAGSAEWAKVWQEGDDNIGDVEQYNDGHDGEIMQKGNVNLGDIYQRGNKTTGEIWSEGNHNVASIRIYGTSDEGTTSGYIEQIGNWNDADQDMGDPQYVDNSQFEAHQLGNSNEADQMMEGNGWPGGVTAEGNTGYIMQDGNGNYGMQDMTNGTGTNMFNDAWLSQTGNNNVSYQMQSRDNNTSTVTQVGNGNYSNSVQN